MRNIYLIEINCLLLLAVVSIVVIELRNILPVLLNGCEAWSVAIKEVTKKIKGLLGSKGLR
jgi:hypothetical protein